MQMVQCARTERNMKYIPFVGKLYVTVINSNIFKNLSSNMIQELSFLELFKISTFHGNPMCLM